MYYKCHNTPKERKDFVVNSSSQFQVPIELIVNYSYSTCDMCTLTNQII